LLTKAYDPNPAEGWRLTDEFTRLMPQQDSAFARRMAEMYVASVIARAGLRDSSHHVMERARAGADIDPRGELMSLEAHARTFLGEHDKANSLLAQYLTSPPAPRAGFGKVNAWWWRDLQKEPRFKILAGMGR
jgi:hypothetical protein